MVAVPDMFIITGSWEERGLSLALEDTLLAGLVSHAGANEGAWH